MIAEIGEYMKGKVAIIQNVAVNDHRMVYTDGIGRELVKRGYDVEVIVQKNDKNHHTKNFPYRLVCLPGDTYSVSGQLVFARNLFRLLRRKEYDIIHGKNPFSSVLPALLLKKIDGKARTIYDIRGLWIDFGVHAGMMPRAVAFWLDRLDRFCMNRVDRVIAISYELKYALVRRGIKEEKIEVVVGDGVDILKARSIGKRDVRDVFGFDGKVVGYVGSIGRARCSERIIEAFGIVKEKSDFNVNLVMVGPFPNELEVEYFQNLVKKMKLKGSIFFTGHVPHDEALQYMKSFDLAVAYHEGNFLFYNVAVPTKVLEYMATGRAIVATNHKMYRNLLTHGRDAYLTEQNPKAFAEGILHLLENDELSERLSKNAEIAAERYSFEKVTDRIEEIYESILNQTAGRA
jgi:glycosyltransferase involved in cell wall biosynthesis